MVNNEYLLQKIQGFLGTDLLIHEEPFELLTIVISKNRNVDLLQYLYNDEELKFQFLTDVCGAHYPDQKDNELSVIYHLHSFTNNIRLRVKCYLPVSEPSIKTATTVFKGANWQERETYDFYGIIFEGHPNLKRIINVDEMDYFPQRKEYPLEDGTRTDKDDKYFGR
ncbi:MAG: NADH-quinone oxidoreductase subunit C [Bacteroidia bacterium]